MRGETQILRPVNFFFLWQKLRPDRHAIQADNPQPAFPTDNDHPGHHLPGPLVHQIHSPEEPPQRQARPFE